nr:MAG TPA: hypothetical protein [Caudoviricetes sp.]
MLLVYNTLSVMSSVLCIFLYVLCFYVSLYYFW